MSWETQELFDPAAGEAARDEGMAVVLHNTPLAYETAFRQRFYELRGLGEPFTSEDITAVVGRPPNHHNAIGALMNACVQEALADGALEVVGWRHAEHKAGHARALRIYRGRTCRR